MKKVTILTAMSGLLSTEVGMVCGMSLLGFVCLGRGQEGGVKGGGGGQGNRSNPRCVVEWQFLFRFTDAFEDGVKDRR